jgi:hypothetical protein
MFVPSGAVVTRPHPREREFAADRPESNQVHIFTVDAETGSKLVGRPVAHVTGTVPTADPPYVDAATYFPRFPIKFAIV